MGYGYGGFYGAPWCPRPVAPVATAPVAAPANGFALIVVLFILLIIVGAAACA